MLSRARIRAFCLSAVFVCLCWTAPLRAIPWLPFGPDGGDARRMATDPRDHAHLYLGTANGWIYESHSSGARWTRLARVGKRDDLVLDSIVVDSQDPLHLIVGAWVIDRPDGGLFTSNDGGATWTSQAEMRGQSIRAVAASVSDPRILVAGTLQGVYRSQDGGQRWKLISPRDSVEIHNIESVAIDPKDPNVIYAGTWHLPWKTTDAGEHWDNIKEGIIEDSDVFSIIVDPTAPHTVYASACSGIYKSENAGLQFRKIQGIPSSARRTRVLLQDPSHRDTVFAGTTEGLFRSEDAGKSWSRTTGPEIIVNDVSVDSTDSHHVLIATDRGGVMASDDGGDTFHSSNAGFSARQITALKRDLQNPATLYVGVVNDKEWGGVFRSENGGVSWSQRSEGLQGRDVFSLGQAPDGTMVAGTAHGLYRLDAEAGTWKRVENAPGSVAGVAAVPPAQTRPPVPVQRNQFLQHKPTKSSQPARRGASLVQGRRSGRHGQPLTVSKKHSGRAVPRPRKLLAVSAKGKGIAPPRRLAILSKQTQIPPPATPPTGGFDGSVYSIVTVGNVMLATTSQGLFASSDNGNNWTSTGIDKGAEWRILSVAKNNVVSASLHSVQFSADAGATWAPIALPENFSQVLAVSVDPAGEVWIGGREGVFVSEDAGATWNRPKNLFVNSVNNIYFDEPTNRIIVTTAGYSSIVFTVQLPTKQVSYADTGWSLRFARPVGDHIIGATLFDGMVLQPRMVDSPMNTQNAPAQSAQR
jgi:photosystem II stability/assembly factor-like uncharacterized protein